MKGIASWIESYVVALVLFMEFILLGCASPSPILSNSMASPLEPLDGFKIGTRTTKSLFEIISDLRFDLQDIAAMYKDVAANKRSTGCSGYCRTPIALWVLQSMSPCSQIIKEDCPKGLVCCSYEEKLDVSSSDIVEITNNTLNDWEFDENKNRIEFVQDPIPGDSDETLI